MPCRLYRIHRQDQERAYRTANECPENGNQSGKRNQHAHKQGIREPQYRHGYKEHRAKNHSLQALPRQEIRSLVLLAMQKYMILQADMETRRCMR